MLCWKEGQGASNCENKQLAIVYKRANHKYLATNDEVLEDFESLAVHEKVTQTV